jgi:dipeptidase E
MKLSGLDNVLRRFAIEDNGILYGGYSAGICVLSPSLKGLELVDDITKNPYPQQEELI